MDFHLRPPWDVAWDAIAVRLVLLAESVAQLAFLEEYDEVQRRKEGKSECTRNQ
jgi:hypothetical protein